MEQIENIPIVWIGFIILGAIFLCRGWIVNSVARAYTGLTICISALGFIFLSWNMMLYGWILLAVATSLLGLGIKFSEFIEDIKPTIFPPKEDE